MHVFIIARHGLSPRDATRPGLCRKFSITRVHHAESSPFAMPDKSDARSDQSNNSAATPPRARSLRQVIERYDWLLICVTWVGGLIALGMLRFDAYGIAEAGAHALVLNWTVSEQIVNPIVTLGPPDFRALLFLPLGLYWPGSMIAVKVFTATLFFGAVLLLHRRVKSVFTPEVALIGSGLMLIAPISFLEINAVGAGPFLLLTFGLAVWADQRYRAKQRQLAGWYFLQLFLAMVAVSLHPAGLAYPLALAWEWARAGKTDSRHRKQFWWGLAIAVLLLLLLRRGWYGLTWWSNPFVSLDAAVFAHIPDAPMAPGVGAGIVLAVLLVAVLVLQWHRIRDNLLARMLGLSIVCGLPAADYSWALLATALLAYFGIAGLVAINERFVGRSFAGQRGLVLGVIFIAATAFMVADKTYYNAYLRQALSPLDHMLDAVASEIGETEDPVKLSSQWPARTMLATRHPAFPLPPVPDNPEQFLPSIKGIAYLLFDPFAEANKPLTDMLSGLTAEFETILVEQRGVVVKVREDATPAPASTPSAPQGGGETLSAPAGHWRE